MVQPNLLQLIKESCTGKIKVIEQSQDGNQYIVFGDFAFTKGTLTPLKVYNKDSEHYSIDSLLYLWENRNESHTTYVKNAATIGVKPVTRADKRDIIDYLSGTKSDLPGIFDPTFIPVASIPPSRLRSDISTVETRKIKIESQRETDSVPEITLEVKKEIIDQPVITEIRDLSDVLTADKIVELRLKKKMTKKKKVAVIPKLEQDFSTLTTPLEVKSNSKLITRTWLTRENCMDTKKTDFSRVLDILYELKMQEEKEKLAKTASAHKSANQKSTFGTARYDRYDQEIFAASLNIDDSMTFVGRNLISFGKLATTKPKINPKPIKQEPRESQEPLPKKRTNKTPIIIIPSTGNMTGSLIDMYNARDILEDMTFRTAEEKKAQGTKRETQIQIHRKFSDRTTVYKVVENPMRLTVEEWDRVVAVFVMGPAWQFKGWKWDGNPVEIFAHIPAFHLHYEDLEVDKNVARWNVTLIPISRDRRHLDRARFVKFWDIVERHIAKNKANLR